MNQAVQKQIPAILTSYDLLKTLAIVLMLADHIGYYFFKDIEWFRVFGRMSVPIWFFLIGYAQSRDLPLKLWASMAVLVVANIIFGLYLIPLNILATIIFVRLVLDKVARIAFRGVEPMAYTLVGLGVLALPTWVFFEYGTIAVILAMAGYALRNRETIPMTDSTLRFFFGFFVLFYAFTQILMFDFTPLGNQVMFVGVGLIGVLLYLFKPQTEDYFEATWPQPVLSLFKLCGRYSLEIYVVHLLIFKALGMALGLPGYGWFDFDLIIH